MSFGTYITKNFASGGAERFFQSPPGRRLVEQATREHEGEIHQQRVALAAQVAAQERQLADALPDLQKEEADARAAHAKLKKQTDGAAARLRIARSIRYSAEGTAENQIVALKARLRQTAPPAIDAFIDQLRAEHEELRQTPFAFHDEPAGFRGKKPIVKRYSNAAAVKRRLAALLAAARETEALKEQAIPTETLPAIFDGIRAALPDANAMEEIVPIEEAIGNAWSASA